MCKVQRFQTQQEFIIHLAGAVVTDGNDGVEDDSPVLLWVSFTTNT